MKIIEFKEKIKNRTLNIGIIGLGYVGLPLAMTYFKKGFKVFGYDVDKNKINSLLNEKNYIVDIDDNILFKNINNKSFIPSNNDKIILNADIIFICVPTPITKNKVPDTTYIESASKMILKHLNTQKLIILRSTSYPGTTENIVRRILDKSGRKIDKDYYLSFAPERIDPGNTKWTSDNTPIVVGGVTKKSGDLSKLILNAVIKDVYQVSNAKIAEMEKLLENIFRSVNIALMNELAQMCDRMGDVNIWEVINAASTKPFGYMPFSPGPGIGGHCILVDPYYLSFKAKEYDFHSDFIQLAAKTNEYMPHYVKDFIIRTLSKNGKNFKNSSILFIGVAFKKNVNDTRNSPAIKIINLLLEFGNIKITYYDPYVSSIKIDNKVYKSEENIYNRLNNYDAIIITTDHDNINYKKLSNINNILIDTRNSMKDYSMNDNYYLIGNGNI